MTDPQRRADRIRAFRDEVDALRAEGAWPLAPEDEAALAAHHDRVVAALAARFDVDRSAAEGQLSRGMRLASFFGAVTLTAAVASLVAEFWGRLDTPVQMLLLLLFPLAALAGVEQAARRERTYYIAGLFALVAYGTFWIALVVGSRQFNLQVQPPGLWMGTLFGLALGLAYRLRLVTGLALAVVPAAAAGALFWAAGSDWTAAIQRLEPFLFSSLFVAVLAAPLGAWSPPLGSVARFVGVGLALGALLVLASVEGTSALGWPPRIVMAIYQGLMLVACLGAIGLGLRRQWADTVNLAAVFLAVFLFIRFVDWFWDALPRFLFFLLLAAVAFGWLLVLRRLRVRLATGGRS